MHTVYWLLSLYTQVHPLKSYCTDRESAHVHTSIHSTLHFPPLQWLNTEYITRGKVTFVVLALLARCLLSVPLPQALCGCQNTHFAIHIVAYAGTHTLTHTDTFSRARKHTVTYKLTHTHSCTTSVLWLLQYTYTHTHTYMHIQYILTQVLT